MKRRQRLLLAKRTWEWSSLIGQDNGKVRGMKSGLGAWWVRCLSEIKTRTHFSRSTGSFSPPSSREKGGRNFGKFRVKTMQRCFLESQRMEELGLTFQKRKRVLDWFGDLFHDFRGKGERLKSYALRKNQGKRNPRPNISENVAVTAWLVTQIFACRYSKKDHK